MRRALACFVLIACGGAQPNVPTWERPGLGGAVRPEMGSPQPGEPAPDFELPRLDGTTTKLSSLRGSWVLLHFTASWCPYCDSEIAHLGEIAERLGPKGARVVLVDVKEEARVWEPYARTHVAPAVIALHDATGEASRRYAPPHAQPSFTDRAQVALDSTLIVDPSGTIRLFLMPDSAHFDPTFAGPQRELERLMATEERVVDVAATPSAEDVAIRLHVQPGYHIMSNRPSQPNYVATAVQVDPPAGVEIGAPIYPSDTPFSLGDRSISTFTGDVEVRVPYRALGAAPRVLEGWVSYQACTPTRCLFPVKQPLVVTLPKR